jgi:hypothetical protein
MQLSEPRNSGAVATVVAAGATLSSAGVQASKKTAGNARYAGINRRTATLATLDTNIATIAGCLLLFSIFGLCRDTLQPRFQQ